MSVDFSQPVLVVDDYKTVVRIMHNLLKQAGAREMGSHCKARSVLGVTATAGRAIGAILLDPLLQHA